MKLMATARLPAVALALATGLLGCGTDVTDLGSTGSGGSTSTTTNTGTTTDTTTTTGTTTNTGTTTSTTTSTGPCTPEMFNFFVISLEAIQAAGGSEGLGGNLGGLAGADALCQSAASSVGAGDKTWVAFLSVTNDGSGQPLNAIDRIGEGPYCDVHGYLLAQNKAGLLQTRPDGDDVDVTYNDGWKDWVFTDCLTTELGNCTHTYGDSHDTLTGSKADGTLCSSNPNSTCNDWTSTAPSCGGGPQNTCWPAIGHTWPAQSGQGWLFSHLAAGCGANINLTDSFETGIGGHGGYGAFYCFAL
jgi:hypothetical protein